MSLSGQNLQDMGGLIKRTVPEPAALGFAAWLVQEGFCPVVRSCVLPVASEQSSSGKIKIFRCHTFRSLSMPKGRKSLPQTFLGANSDFPPRKPPLSSEQTQGFLRASREHIYKNLQICKIIILLEPQSTTTLLRHVVTFPFSISSNLHLSNL